MLMLKKCKQTLIILIMYLLMKEHIAAMALARESNWRLIKHLDRCQFAENVDEKFYSFNIPGSSKDLLAWKERKESRPVD